MCECFDLVQKTFFRSSTRQHSRVYLLASQFTKVASNQMEWSGSWTSRVCMQSFTRCSVTPIGTKSPLGSREGLGLFTKQLLHNISLEGVSISLSAPIIVCLFYCSHPSGRAMVSLVLVSFSLVTDYIEHLFSPLWPFLSSLEQHLFKSFTKNWIVLVFLLFSCKSSLYILVTSPLPGKWSANILFHPVSSLFMFLMVFFETQMTLILMKSVYQFCLLLLTLLLSCLRNHCLIQDHKDLLLCFLLRISQFQLSRLGL